MSARRALSGMALLMITAACQPTGEPGAKLPEASENDLADARAAAGQLGGELKAQLVAAMQAEGPIGGVRVCAEVADDIAAGVSGETGLEVGRTSLRVRNASNAPDDWETEGLNYFSEAIADGTPREELSYFTVVERGDEPVLRWMSPIMMGEVCQTCHGTDVSDEVKAVIAEYYPNDLATGFRAGELRGAFTVEKVIAD